MRKKLKCILLIDDDSDCNYFHQKLFNRLDCVQEIKIVNDGRQALNFLATKVDGRHPVPELIFLDINMPRMNGWEFLEEYQKLDSDAKENVILIMLTSSLNPDDKEKAKGFEEVKGFKSKYLNKDGIIKILEEYFPEHF